MVKTGNLGSRQFFCPGTIPAMEIKSKPYGDIAERLRWHRELMDMSQEEYAARIGQKRAALNNWEGGDYRLSLNGALALRKAFGLSLDFMVKTNFLSDCCCADKKFVISSPHSPLPGWEREMGETDTQADKPSWTPAVKGFNADLTCRGFQFAEGGEYSHEGSVKACESDFQPGPMLFDRVREAA